MIPKLLDAAIKLFTGIVEAIPKVLPKLIAALIDMLPLIVSTLIGMVPTLIQAGVDLVSGLVKGLWQAAGAVGKALLSIAKQALGSFLSFFGIKSPSRKMAQQGKYLIQGLAGGISKNVRLVDNAMGKLNTRVESGFNASLSAPPLTYLGAGYGASGAAPAAVYNVTVNTLNATAETGRVIVQSIRDYENTGGRL
jgi:phage-related protein